MEKCQDNWQLASRLPYLVVLCRTKEDAETTIGILRSWLADRGLSLSQEKTRIVHLSEGFDFLGFHVRRYRTRSRTTGEILLIRPSRESLRAFRARLKQEWLSLHGRNAATVVKRLNPVIKGWGNYFRVCNLGQELKKLDRFLYHRALRYGLRQHPNKGKRWIVARYFGQYHPTRNDRWVFGDKDSGRYLWKLSWMHALRHTVVAYRASPDDATLAAYWEQRAKAKLRTLTPSRQKMALRQKGRCPVCGDHLMNEEELHIHHVQSCRAQGGNAYDNLRLVHLYCHHQADRETREEWDAE
jgi:RNA-directed DNA polymerase